MQENPPESNFRPQSPLSLYSYVDPSRQPKVQAEAKKTSVSGEEVGAKSILKSTKVVQQVQQQVAAQVPAPRVKPSTSGSVQPRPSLERRKTVAFGRTVPVSQTIEVGNAFQLLIFFQSLQSFQKDKQKPVEKPLATSAFLRAKQYIPGMKELDDIRKQVC